MAPQRRVFRTHVLHFERNAQKGLPRGLAVERVEALRLVAAESHGLVNIVTVHDLHGQKPSVPHEGPVGELFLKENADAVARLHVPYGIDFALPDGFELFTQSRGQAQRSGRLQKIASRPGRSVSFLGVEGEGMNGDREGFAVTRNFDRTFVGFVGPFHVEAQMAQTSVGEAPCGDELSRLGVDDGARLGRAPNPGEGLVVLDAETGKK